VAVSAGPDVADDWIAERARPRRALSITADIPLAARCGEGGRDDVMAPNGKRLRFEASIGMALATRNLMEDLRAAGEQTRGPRAFAPRDRSAFLSALETAVQRLKRAGF
jgi:uncharacterized protein YaiI (UPF0178 family)